MFAEKNQKVYPPSTSTPPHTNGSNDHHERYDATEEETEHDELDASVLFNDEHNFFFLDRICSSLFDQQTLLSSAYHSKHPTMKNNFKRRKVDRKYQQKNRKQETKRRMMSQEDLFTAATPDSTKKCIEFDDTENRQEQQQQQKPRDRLHTPKFHNKRLPKVGPNHWKRLGPD